MPGNRQSFTTILCASVSDAARLATYLGQPAAWAGSPVPELVEANGAEVDLTWFTQAGIPASAPAAAITSARGSAAVTSSVTVTHKTTASGGSVTTSRQ